MHNFIMVVVFFVLCAPVFILVLSFGLSGFGLLSLDAHLFQKDWRGRVTQKRGKALKRGLAFEVGVHVFSAQFVSS